MDLGVPAGSFKYERFVRSSLASRIVGFIGGGRRGLESSCNAATVVSSARVYRGMIVSSVRYQNIVS